MSSTTNNCATLFDLTVTCQTCYCLYITQDGCTVKTLFQRLPYMWQFFEKLSHLKPGLFRFLCRLS